MVESPAKLKSDEQFPLLMVAGAGDAGAVRSPPSTVGSLWNTVDSIQHRRPWSDRWPEYLSTCWMSFILIGVSFMVFYAIGMLVIYRHDTYLVVKCNETKPASNVYYHDIIPRGANFPLNTYFGYLSNVATQYPSLKFNVIFLIDDTVPYTFNKRNNIYTQLLNPYPNHFEEYNIHKRREVRDFQRKHPNINITVMLLSKYMAMTPLKYRWRIIPTSFLPFYARVYAVWYSGGIGLDLKKENELYMNGHFYGNRKTSAILRQHNDGISAEKYAETLDKIERDEESEFFTAFFSMVQKMFNETVSIFNRTIPFGLSTEYNLPQNEQSLIRTHRNKRSISKDISIYNNTTKKDNEIKVANETSIINIVLANATAFNETDDKNIYQISANDTVPITHASTEDPNYVNNASHVSTQEQGKDSAIDISFIPSKSEIDRVESENNKTDYPQILFFYDFSFVSEPRPEKDLPKPGLSPRSISPTKPKFVTVDAEGSFVAATSQMHPFLASVMSSGCKRMHPRIAIQNALISQCSGIYRDKVYCNSIHVF